MIEAIPFQTRARTIDHLGREQIADCPTAISELWKNAYDAYASAVALHVYDGDSPVAAMLDDGHGMSRDEFVNKWLVVGTESKTGGDNTPQADRFGLSYRPKQGQKGIGRLSCANLGPILLLITKRAGQDLIVSLIDWRFFENPFLNLSDIHLPVAALTTKESLFEQLPSLFTQLMDNLWGGSDEPRASRIRAAWEAYDRLYEAEASAGESNKNAPPSQIIAETIIDAAFSERHLREWGVWSGEKDHGTALLVSKINFDLGSQLPDSPRDTAAEEAKRRLFETLSNFVDPFIDPTRPDGQKKDHQFAYEFCTWLGDRKSIVVASDKEFNLRTLEPLEHQVVGRIDAHGVFRGKIKAYGAWIDSEEVIHPPKDLRISVNKDGVVGPVDLYISTMEQLRENTTMSKADFDRFNDIADKYAGFMLYRDGLRVLPFGRVDNDFFSIEERRSKSAGREYWQKRRMFGRLAISRGQNPNLKDKSGREGFLDNTAAKTFRAIVINVLIQTARQYFGSASELRQTLLPQIREENSKQRLSDDRNKLRKKQRSQFASNLKRFAPFISVFAQDMRALVSSMRISDESELEHAQELLEEGRETLSSLRLVGAPTNLGSLENSYGNYNRNYRAAAESIGELSEKVEIAQSQIKPASPKEVLEKKRDRLAAYIFRKTAGWKSEITRLQREENKRILALIEQRNKVFHAGTPSIVSAVENGAKTLSQGLKAIQDLSDKINSENKGLFEPYIRTLESLQESIDLEALATFGLEENVELRHELDRLNALAQLGITVEIVGHDLQDYDDILAASIRSLPDDVQQSRAAKDIRFAVEALTDQLRFLSPLKLSGLKTSQWITGQEIYSYIAEFFSQKFSRSNISFVTTNEFRNFKVFDQPSRLYPVFMNLVNNSLYWLSTRDYKDRTIGLYFEKGRIIVSDNGPGVDEQDVPNLFSLFFTKKLRGGRGVGLYLCRANLAANGHKISYIMQQDEKILSGANFAIDVRGGE